VKPSVVSKNDVPIRVTTERWGHITSGHPELRGKKETVLRVLTDPELVVEGDCGELAAVRQIDTGRWLIVVYKELGDEGYIITAFFSKEPGYYLARLQLWP
jgi:hypothetical protein